MSDETRESTDVADSTEPQNDAERPPADAGQPLTQEERVAALEREVQELQDKNLRLLAELRNQQQRAQRDKGEALKYAETEFARSVLPVLDDLERTLQSAAQASDAASVAEGVRIVQEHFLKILKAHHIVPIEAVGRPFDPDVHEAMLQQPSEEHPAGVVMQELARGYRMHERVIRPAKVVVSSGPGEG